MGGGGGGGGLIRCVYRGVAVSSREGSKHSPPCFLAANNVDTEHI